MIEINGVRCLHINEFSPLIHRTVPTVRHLLFKGNVIRKLKGIREGSSVYICEAELTGYPFTDSGLFNGMIYHYRKQENGTYLRELCKKCTFTTEKCAARKMADSIEVDDVQS